MRLNAPEAEKAYIRRIKNLVNGRRFTNDTIPELQTQLNAIMAERFAQLDPETGLGRERFEFYNAEEVRLVFDEIVETSETTLNRWLTTGGGGCASFTMQSDERMALLDLVYCNVMGFNTKKNPDGTVIYIPKCPALLDALANENRPEAWFEIRYKSNLEQSGAIAKRRYYESDLFNLYDAGQKTDEEQILEDKTIFSMYTRHGDKIESYDEQFGAQVSNANRDYYQCDWVKNFAKDTEPAKNDLVARFGKGQTIDNVFVSKGLSTYEYLDNGNYNDIVVGTDKADLIFGEEGNQILNGDDGIDVIYGGEGNDTIIGGKCDDILYGGPGDDNYIINTGDGTDRIEDKEHGERGDMVIMNTTPLGPFVRRVDGTFERYESPDHLYRGEYRNNQQGGRDFVVSEYRADGSATGLEVILNEDFQEGDFGIKFYDELTPPDNPVTNNVIQGDLRPIDFDPTQDGIQAQYDQWGNVITDPAQPDEGRNDILYDTPDNDLILAGGGDDVVRAFRGGEDWIRGGDRDEVLMPLSLRTSFRNSLSAQKPIRSRNIKEFSSLPRSCFAKAESALLSSPWPRRLSSNRSADCPWISNPRRTRATVAGDRTRSLGSVPARHSR